MNAMRSACFIATRDVAYMLKQKETILWVFLMPFVFFFFIGKMAGGGDRGGSAARAPVSVAILDPGGGGFLVDELFAAIEAQNFELVRVATQEELEQHARRLILPAPAEGSQTLTESLLAGHPAKIVLQRDSDGQQANLDKVRLGRAVYGLLADFVVLESSGAAVTQGSLDALQAMPRSLSLTVEPAGKRITIPSGYSQTVPGTLVMFTLLVLLTSGSVQILTERKRGLLRRLASAPISRSSIVLGKWAGRMSLALVQIGFAMLGGTFLFGMEWGQDLPMVCVVLVCWAAFCTSVALFLANVVRTEPQMSGIGVVSSMALAALGGCWWPIEVTPAWMQSLASFLPTGWVMNALHQLIHFGNGPATALSAIGLLLASSLVFGLFAVRRFRYQ